MMVSTALLGAGVVGTTAATTLMKPQVAQASTIPSGDTYQNPVTGATYHKIGNHWFGGSTEGTTGSQQEADVYGFNFVNFKLVDSDTGATVKTISDVFVLTQQQITDLNDIGAPVDGYVITDYVDQEVTSDGQTVTIKVSKTDSGSDDAGDTSSNSSSENSQSGTDSTANSNDADGTESQVGDHTNSNSNAGVSDSATTSTNTNSSSNTGTTMSSDNATSNTVNTDLNTSTNDAENASATETSSAETTSTRADSGQSKVSTSTSAKDATAQADTNSSDGQKAATLPQTDEANSGWFALVGTILLSRLGALSFRKFH